MRSEAIATRPAAGKAPAAEPAGPPVLERLRDEIRLRHYSIRTEHAYVDWTRRFVAFHDNRSPSVLGVAEINRFLTHLATNCNVAASTQNQALNALVFLYAKVLKRDIGSLGEIVRAKRPARIPVVLLRTRPDNPAVAKRTIATAARFIRQRNLPPLWRSARAHRLTGYRWHRSARLDKPVVATPLRPVVFPHLPFFQPSIAPIFPMNPAFTYADGKPYRAPWGNYFRDERPIRGPFVSPGLLRETSRAPGKAVPCAAAEWPDYWQTVQRHLRKARFSLSTLRVYRQVLRSFKAFVESNAPPPWHPVHRRFANTGPALRNNAALGANDAAPAANAPPSPPPPAHATCALAHDYLVSLTRKRNSASWLSVNISVLRTVFDKLGGLAITAGVRTPKRSRHLPECLTPPEREALALATPDFRHRLLIGLMHGSGLKVGEVCALRWDDLDEAGMLRVRFAGGRRERRVAVPARVLPLLRAGATGAPPGAFVFPGRRAGTHLTERMTERIVQKVARLGGIARPITCMMLRHDYAISRLREGMSIVELHVALGHSDIQTTLVYERCLLREGVVSPADRLNLAGPARPQPPNETQRSAVGPPPEAAPLAADTFAQPLAPDAPGEYWQLLKRGLAAWLRPLIHSRKASSENPCGP